MAKKTFFIFRKFLKLNKGVAVWDFPRIVRLAFQPPMSFGVLLCFWKVKTVSGRLDYFPIGQILAALQIPVKMNLVQILCLARHSMNSFS